MVEHETESVTDATGDVVENLLPWGVSILLHAGLLLIALFIGYTAIVDAPEGEQQIIVTSHIYNPRPDLLVTQAGPASTELSPVEMKPSVATVTPVSMTNSQNFSPVRSINGKGPGRGTGLGDKDGDGSGTGLGGSNTGWSGDFGGGPGGPGRGKVPPGGLSIACSPGGIFNGQPGGTNARKVVYLIDASGSLIDTMPFVLMELRKAITELSPQQKFAVVFFYADHVAEYGPPGLKQATAENRDAAVRWLDPKAGNVIPMGPTNPMKGLETALRYSPDVLHLLSDNITGSGPYEVDQRRLLADINKINRKQTKICTIQFIKPDKLAINGETPVMQKIAERSGGLFRFYSARDLELQ